MKRHFLDVQRGKYYCFAMLHSSITGRCDSITDHKLESGEVYTRSYFVSREEPGSFHRVGLYLWDSGYQCSFINNDLLSAKPVEETKCEDPILGRRP